MSRLTHSASGRSGQVQASTLFALTLALLAGLIGAFLFKTYVLNGKSNAAAPPPAPQVSFTIVVAAANIPDRTRILAGHVKTVNVGEAEYQRITSNAKYLRGQQPVGRITLKSVRAEEPIYEDYVEPLAYAGRVSDKLRPGKREITLEVPAKQVMVREGDHVDVMCTIANSAFGIGRLGTATAVVAKDSRVLARDNTTRTDGRPPPGATTRTYTLEMSPYRVELVELARNMDAKFTLTASARVAEGGIVREGAPMNEDPTPERVTLGDLARAFGIDPVVPARLTSVDIELWTDLRKRNTITYQNALVGDVPVPGRPTQPGGAPFMPMPPAGGSGFQPPGASGPAFQPPGSTPGTPGSGPRPPQVTPGGSMSGLQRLVPDSEFAGADLNAGFSPPATTGPKKCASCEAKRKKIPQ